MPGEKESISFFLQKPLFEYKMRIIELRTIVLFRQRFTLLKVFYLIEIFPGKFDFLFDLNDDGVVNWLIGYIQQSLGG